MNPFSLLSISERIILASILTHNIRACSLRRLRCLCSIEGKREAKYSLYASREGERVACACTVFAGEWFPLCGDRKNTSEQEVGKERTASVAEYSCTNYSPHTTYAVHISRRPGVSHISIHAHPMPYTHPCPAPFQPRPMILCLDFTLRDHKTSGNSLIPPEKPPSSSPPPSPYPQTCQSSLRSPSPWPASLPPTAPSAPAAPLSPSSAPPC